MCYKNLFKIQIKIFMLDYPSDISRSQFAIILPVLESARKKTSPRTVDLYDVFRGILYVLKSGCQWRMMPKDYPKWSTCYYYFVCWSKKKDLASETIFEEVLKKISKRSPDSRQ